MAQRGQQHQSKRGDFTGNQKDVLTREHEEVLDSRRKELGLIDAGKKAIKDDGIIDLTSGKPVLEGSDELIDMAAREPGVIVEEELPADGVKIGSSTAAYDVHELAEEKPQAAAQGDEVLTPELMNAPTLVRVLFDLEDVTIGYGSTFTFRAGYRYRVPRWVAGHLEEKGLADVLSLTA